MSRIRTLIPEERQGILRSWEGKDFTVTSAKVGRSRHVKVLERLLTPSDRHLVFCPSTRSVHQVRPFVQSSPSFIMIQSLLLESSMRLLSVEKYSPLILLPSVFYLVNFHRERQFDRLSVQSTILKVEWRKKQKKKISKNVSYM